MGLGRILLSGSLGLLELKGNKVCSTREPHSKATVISASKSLVRRAGKYSLAGRVCVLPMAEQLFRKVSNNYFSG